MSLRRLVVATLLVSSAAFPEERPTLGWGPDGLTLARLPPVLAEPTVARHLETGLTTVFVLEVEGRGGPKLTGGAHVSVRYDLWDEVYVVETADARGRGATTTLPSRTALLDWWRAIGMVVAPTTASAPPLREARVTLQVLPFSQAEQRDAQDWLLRTLRQPDRAATPPPLRDSAPQAREPVREFYGAMLASSIGRRSLITYSWTVSVGAR